MSSLPQKESSGTAGRAARKQRGLPLFSARVMRYIKTAFAPAQTSDIDELLARLGKAREPAFSLAYRD